MRRDQTALLCGRRQILAAALLLAGLVTTQFALGRNQDLKTVFPGFECPTTFLEFLG